MIKKIKTKKYRPGFLIYETIGALTLLGILAFVIIKFEHYASTTAQSLDQQYIAAVAAESQFERLRAGLDVLDPKTFWENYPRLTLDYKIQPSDNRIGVVTISTRDQNPRILMTLTGPVSSVREKQE